MIALYICFSIMFVWMFLLFVELVIAGKQRFREISGGWIAWIIAYIVVSIPCFYAMFSSNQWYSFDKLWFFLFPWIIFAMTISDPDEIYYAEYDKESKEISFVLPTFILLSLSIAIGCVLAIHSKNYRIEQFKEENFKTCQIYMYKQCPDEESPEHIHIVYFNKDGFKKELKFYPKLTVTSFSQIDPKDVKGNTGVVILNDKNINKIMYLHTDKDGDPKTPYVIYCDNYYYENQIKKFVSN